MDTPVLATLCYLQRTHVGRDETLMLHRVKKRQDIHEGKWNGLGGKFLPGETPEQCVIREVQEESGLLVEHPLLKGFISFPKFDGVRDWYVFVFTADRFSGMQIECAEGDLEWIPKERVASLPLWEGDIIFIPWLDRPGIFSACFSYEQGRLASHEVHFYP